MQGLLFWEGLIFCGRGLHFVQKVCILYIQGVYILWERIVFCAKGLFFDGAYILSEGFVYCVRVLYFV